MSYIPWIVRAIACLCLGSQAGPSLAAGHLDTRFGSSGYARFSGAGAPGPQAIAVRPDGTTVFAAPRPTTTRDIVVGAVNSDGRADGRFAGGGLLTITTGGTLYRPLLQYDARTQMTLLAASDYRNGAYHLLICRIRADGALDLSFSVAGYSSQAGCVSITPPAFAPSGVLVAGLMPLADGRILVGGSAYNFGASTFRAFEGQVTPLEAGSGGASLLQVPVLNNVFINAVTFHPALGDIYFAGFQRVNDSDSALLVARLGVSDIQSYLYNGNFTANGLEDGRAITFRNTNEIYVAGTIEIQGGKTDCMVFRLNRSMQVVNSFGPGANGRRTVRFNGGNNDSASCEALQAEPGSEGRLLVGGRVGQNGDQFQEMAVARLAANGDFMPDFGNAGTVRINQGLAPQRSERVLALDTHLGRPVLAGPSELATGATPQTTDMLLVRVGNDDVIFTSGMN
jgi:uncharacterized delta-60 repeat protein